MTPGLQWWCSARGVAWSWEWQPYPGVWLAAALAGSAVHVRIRRGRLARFRGVAMLAGALLLWLATDWPVGALGAGYLASVHAVQFVMLAMVVPPLLLLGADREARTVRGPRVEAFRRAVTQPLVTAATFSVVMVATHLPNVVDGLMRFQWGAFALDLIWFGAGCLFWWPVIVPEAGRPWFHPFLRCSTCSSVQWRIS